MGMHDDHALDEVVLERGEAWNLLTDQDRRGSDGIARVQPASRADMGLVR